MQHCESTRRVADLVRVLGAIAWTLVLNGCALPPERGVALEHMLADCQVARDRCLSDLGACQVRGDDLRRERESWQAIAESDAGKLESLDAEVERCRARALESRQESSDLVQRETMLRDRLRQELASKDVEIERLKDSLALRMLDRILFESGSAAILPEGRAVLDKIAAVLKQADDYVRVAGHTDNVPIGPVLQRTYPSNWELSAARAASVLRYLQERHGLPPTRLELAGFSMYRPVADNQSEEGRQRNRRVEITLTRTPG
ncbi:MAG: OmpA family protein [Gammaproteobacteria bacterium]|nr:OmpA family protein [Gammaproteobacteria bacterium]